MADKLMYITNYDTKITPSLDFNFWLKRWTLNLMNQPIQIQ